jgi:hypothetical protein
MDVETTIRDSLSYLRNDDDWMKTALVGGVLLLFSWLLVPIFVLYGFYLRILRGAIHNDEQPPAFEDFGSLLSDGLRAFAVALAYAAVPIVVWVFFLVVGGVLRGALGALVGLVGSLVMFVLGLAIAYLLPAGLASLAESDSIGAAFDVEAIRPVVTSTNYAMSWLVGFAMVFVAGFVAWIPILGQAVAFYAISSWLYIVGTAWSQAHPVDLMDEGEMPDERPAI